ncbi:MAG: hypothetical protein GX285_11065 [Clostridiales bacterium]|nr:hypothetical protein [Clostridiales bacterium]
MRSSFRIIKNVGPVREEKKCTIPINEIKIHLVRDTEEDNLEQILTENEAIIEGAKAEAEKIIREALIEAETEARLAAESIKEKAFNEAYAEGFHKGQEDGYQQGYEEGVKESELLRKQAKMVLENAHKNAQEMIEKNEGEIIDLALHIASKLMLTTLQKDDMPLIKMAQDACREFKDKKHVIISVHPEKKAFFETNIDVLKKICPHTTFSILEDEKISETGCVIESDAQVIDTQITVQLDKVREALLEMGISNEG